MKNKEKEYEFYRNGTIHGTVTAKSLREARGLVFAAFGEKLEVHIK